MKGEKKNNQNTKSSFIAVVCFGVLSYLTAKSMNFQTVIVVLLTVAGMAFLGLGLKLLEIILSIINKKVIEAYGKTAVKACLSTGYLVLLPFTIMACVADLYFKWNSSQVFASAGLMTAGSLTGSEIMKIGGKKISSILVSALGSFALSALWIYILMIFKALGGQ